MTLPLRGPLVALLPLALAGCLAAPSAPLDATAGAEAPAGPASATVADAAALATFPVSAEGRLAAAAGGREVGFVSAAPVTGMERWIPLDVEGTVVGGTLTLTWDRGLAGPTELLLAFGPTEPMDDGRDRLKEGFPFVRGPSPLVLALGEQTWEEDAFAIATYWSDAAGASAEQAFAVEGELLLAAV